MFSHVNHMTESISSCWRYHRECVQFRQIYYRVDQNGNFDKHFRKPKFKQKSCISTVDVPYMKNVVYLEKNCQFFSNLSNIQSDPHNKLSQSTSGLTSSVIKWFEQPQGGFVVLSLCLTEAR